MCGFRLLWEPVVETNREIPGSVGSLILKLCVLHFVCWFHCFDPHHADLNNFLAQNTPCPVHVAWYCFQPWQKMLVGQPIFIKFAISHLDKPQSELQVNIAWTASKHNRNVLLWSIVPGATTFQLFNSSRDWNCILSSLRQSICFFYLIILFWNLKPAGNCRDCVYRFVRLLKIVFKTF